MELILLSFSDRSR